MATMALHARRMPIVRPPSHAVPVTANSPTKAKTPPVLLPPRHLPKVHPKSPPNNNP